MSNKQWSWWAGEGFEPEMFTVEAPSRDLVITRARAEFGAREAFSIIEATKAGSFETNVFEADDQELQDVIIQSFTDLNAHRFGEDGLDDFPPIDADLSHALNAAFAVWLAPHEAGIPTFTFTDSRNLELIAPEEHHE